MFAVLIYLSVLASLLCRFTVRDVGFVFIGEPLVHVEADGVRRASDGQQLPMADANVFHGGAHRRALAQDLLESTAVVVLLPGAHASRHRAAVDDALTSLQSMSDAGRFARPIDLPITLHMLDVDADPVAAFALGWTPDHSSGAAVLYGRGRLAGPVLFGGHLDRDAVLDQLSLVAESCECDRPRAWLHARHLPLPWDEDLRRRATASLGFDPHNPRIKAEMERILARGPQGSTKGLVKSADRPDPLLGYDEVHIQASAASPSAAAPRAFVVVEEAEPRVSQGLFWFFIGIGVVVLVGVAMAQVDKKAA